MKRTEIARCGLKLYEQKGIKFTMDEIAKELHISKKSIYVLFDNKIDLLNAMIDLIFEDIGQQYEEILLSGMPTAQKLYDVIMIFPKVINANAMELMPVFQYYPMLHDQLTRRFQSNVNIVLTLLKKGIEEGSLRYVSDEAFRALILGLIDRSICSENPVSVQKQGLDLIFSGLLL